MIAIANYQLPIAKYLLSIAYCLLSLEGMSSDEDNTKAAKGDIKTKVSIKMANLIENY